LLAILYIYVGLFTAASYALFMDITDPRIGATQSSPFVGATDGCESWSSFAVGRLIFGYNYADVFLITSVLSLTSLHFRRLKIVEEGLHREIFQTRQQVHHATSGYEKLLETFSF
jgi:hypothetical protein